MKTTKMKSPGSLQSVVKCLAFIVVWFFRTLIGVTAFGGAVFLAYQAYEDWPTPLYALLLIVGIMTTVGVCLWLYVWATDKLDT